jgi:hypothetical protein
MQDLEQKLDLAAQLDRSDRPSRHENRLATSNAAAGEAGRSCAAGGEPEGLRRKLVGRKRPCRELRGDPRRRTRRYGRSAQAGGNTTFRGSGLPHITSGAHLTVGVELPLGAVRAEHDRRAVVVQIAAPAGRVRLAL